MNNPQIATILDQIADLLDFKGENPFRVNSYRRAARSIRDLREDVAALAERDELCNVPGIGTAMEEKVREFLTTSQVKAHQELMASFPPSLPKLLEIPGLGPKKIAVLFNELKVASVADLQAAIAEGKVEKLTGFGRKTAEKILEGIKFLDRSAGRTPLGRARPIAEDLCRAVGELPGVKQVEMAGSLRRGCETIGDIDLLCEAKDGESVIQAFTQLPQTTAVRAAGDTKGSILVPNPAGGEIQVDLRVVPRESFGAALVYFTGSKEHNIRLREIAIKKGWRLNEYGLFDGEKQIAPASEAGIYRKLGLTYVPPELREDRGEIEAGGRLPDLLTLEDIRGDLHVHTTASDGKCSIEEMAEAAKQRGYQYLAITDHSRSSVIANGLSMERLLKHMEAVRQAGKRIKGITLLTGTECDILSDGSLDYPDDVLAQLDWVVASIHSAQRQDRENVTKRSIAALENPYVCVLGHPSGRLLGKRDAMDLDWEAVIAAAARTGTALEVNSSWQRLDLKDVHVRMAMDAGCRLTIDTDAHRIEQLEQMSLGVQTARRGWAAKDRVLNTRPLPQLLKWVKDKRR